MNEKWWGRTPSRKPTREEGTLTAKHGDLVRPRIIRRRCFVTVCCVWLGGSVQCRLASWLAMLIRRGDVTSCTRGVQPRPVLALIFCRRRAFAHNVFFAGRESGSQGLCDAPPVSFSPFSFHLGGVRDTSVSAFAVVGPGCSLQLGWPGYFSYFFVKQLQPLRWSVHPTPGKVSHVWPKPL